MRIVITGAAGFIGSVLALRAHEIGHEVLALDDLSRGLNPIQDVRGLTFVKHDCQGGFAEAREATRVGGVMQDNWDAVVHLAAGTGSLDRPLEELRALNVEMTKRVYADAVRCGARAFAFPTTSLALGVPDSPYVISKEEAFAWVKEQHEIPVLPLRFFNVAGAYKGFTERRRNEVHIIPRLVECYTTNQIFTINGSDYVTVDGTPSRDFVNVLDVVETILHLLSRMAEHDRPTPVLTEVDGAVWIGTGITTTAYQALSVFEQYVGPVSWHIGPRRAFDVGRLRCPQTAVDRLLTARRLGLAPAWVSIRDEALELLKK